MDLQYLDNLIPWEKEAYILMLLQWIEAEKMRIEAKARARR
jgi:hypothetical protein